ILALGEAGSWRAQHVLSWLAGFGHRSGESAPVSALAQPLAVIALGLARGGVLGEEAKRLAANERDPALRCRAIESLGNHGDDKVMGPLMRELSGRNLAARRSAALALARVGSDLATPGLMTAFELEKEQLTRGFLLLAIGQRGEPAGE